MNHRELIGKKADEAKKICESLDIPSRILYLGKENIITADYKNERLSLIVDENLTVVDVELGG